MTNHLYDADKVEQLIIQYGRSGSAELKEQCQERIVEETIGTVYCHKSSKEPQFFSGVPRLVALIQAHQRYDDPNLLNPIEREIEVMQSGKRFPVATFDQMPFPYASPTKLLALSERFDEDDPGMGRYFRLRAFQSAGVFMDTALPKIRGGEDAELTEEEVEYLQPM